MAASKIVRPCQNISVRCPQDILISAIIDRKTPEMTKCYIRKTKDKNQETEF